ncbi:MAG: GNAT family N-acetyltransferase [Alphaproteobacteria bacterium]|nr:GNAT family N-acetyltransferase [Alphaproteobacteria bacterium]
MSTSKVDVALARADERTGLANMMQLYIHDFGELWSREPPGELGDDGRYADYPLDDYWRQKDRIPLLLRLDGRLIGFALVNTHSHSGLTVDRSMAEFFVARAHRRGGAGTIAAREIFSRYPGQWEAAVTRRNTGALPFWRHAIQGHPRVDDIEERDYNTPDWNGPIIRFRIKPA